MEDYQDKLTIVIPETPDHNQGTHPNLCMFFQELSIRLRLYILLLLSFCLKLSVALMGSYPEHVSINETAS